MKRRSYLIAGGTALTASLAGCQNVLSRDDSEEYSFSLYNGSQESHSFRVQIGNDGSGANFYNETHNLDGGTADEDVRIDDIPAHIFISIDSSDKQEYRWPASYSELGEIASQAEIYYEPGYRQEVFILSD